MKKILRDWEISTSELTRHFCEKYFPVPIEVHWVADQIGGVLYVNDYFFNMNDIVDFIRYDYSVNKMFDYYDYSLKMLEDKENPVCIRDYKKLK